MDKMDLQEWIIKKINETEFKKQHQTYINKLQFYEGKLEVYAEFGKKLLELD